MGEGEQLRLLVESIEDYAIYMLDCANRVLTWNPGAERSKGYTKEEVLGKHFSMFFVPEDVTSRVPDRELTKAMRTREIRRRGMAPQEERRALLGKLHNYINTE